MDANGWVAVATWVGAAVAASAAVPAVQAARIESALRRCDLRVLYLPLNTPDGQLPEVEVSVQNWGPAIARRVTARIDADGAVIGMGGMTDLAPGERFSVREARPAHPGTEVITLVLSWLDGRADEWEEVIHFSVDGGAQGDLLPDVLGSVLSSPPAPVEGALRRRHTGRSKLPR